MVAGCRCRTRPRFRGQPTTGFCATGPATISVTAQTSFKMSSQAPWTTHWLSCADRAVSESRWSSRTPCWHCAVGRTSTRGNSSTYRLTGCGRRTSGVRSRLDVRLPDRLTSGLRVFGSGCWTKSRASMAGRQLSSTCETTASLGKRPFLHWLILVRDGDVERDLLAGRAGISGVRRSRLLLPMGFRDVLKVTAHQIPLPVPVAPWNLQGQETATAAATLEPFTDELDLAWQAYLTSGVFRALYPNITVLALSASHLCETSRPGCTSTLIERPRSIRSRF